MGLVAFVIFKECRPKPSAIKGPSAFPGWMRCRQDNSDVPGQWVQGLVGGGTSNRAASVPRRLRLQRPKVFFVLGPNSMSMEYSANLVDAYKKVTVKGAESGSACPSIRAWYRKGGKWLSRRRNKGEQRKALHHMTVPSFSSTLVCK